VAELSLISPQAFHNSLYQIITEAFHKPDIFHSARQRSISIGFWRTFRLWKVLQHSANAFPTLHRQKTGSSLVAR